jgi:dipeptidyl aminopeptidase/acylaminoacyl peptidase
VSNTTKQSAPFGSWNSPITADAVVIETLQLSEPRPDGKDVYWIEGRPPLGRGVIVVRSEIGDIADVTPPGFDARSQVYSYGGGAYTVHQGTVYFVHYSDNQIYKQSSHRTGAGQIVWGAPTKITSRPNSLFADLCVDSTRNRLIAIKEDRPNPDDAINATHTLVAIDINSGNEIVLDTGFDFYSSPALNPDGSKLAWLCWSQPNMQWTSSYAFVATFDQAGQLRNKHSVAGGPAESVFQPQWSPSDDLYFVSDRAEFWNLYRLNGISVEPVLQRQAEFAIPQWHLGESTYAFLSADKMVYSYTEDGIWRLGALDTSTLTAAEYDTKFSSITGVRATAGAVVIRCSTPAQPVAICSVDPDSGVVSPLKYALPADSFQKFRNYFSTPQPIRFTTSDGDFSYGFFYPPFNPDWDAPRGEKPPLLVMSHGGPTAAADTGLSLSMQFWTSRGFAVLDVNYRGSTGFGRSYREKLYRQWGVFDVLDCISGAAHLIKQGKVDGNKLAVRGGSAGGYTTLCALTFHNAFKVGASYFGISDLKALAMNTHKLELHYLDWLIAPFKPDNPLYYERSPINFVDRLSAPIIFLHGEKDQVVPLEQAEKMYFSLLGRHVPTCLLIFQGERHGFRQSSHNRSALESELLFYAINLLRTPIIS